MSWGMQASVRSEVCSIKLILPEPRFFLSPLTLGMFKQGLQAV